MSSTGNQLSSTKQRGLGAAIIFSILIFAYFLFWILRLFPTLINDEYPALDPLLATLGAELAATRKVTDHGWLPRSRQIGITGRTIAPRLYVAIGTSGKFNHMVGVRAAGTVLAVNRDPEALVFEASDLGIVGDWHEVVPLLVAELARVAAAWI